MDLDAKPVLSNKLVDDLKCENKSLKMHAKCLIAKLIAKNENVICCNHVVKPNFVPIVSFTSKDKLVYIPPHKKNQKVKRKALKPKPLFRSQYSMLKREQNRVAISLPKKPSRPKRIVCHFCGTFGHLRPYCSKFQVLKRIKRKEKLELHGS